MTFDQWVSECPKCHNRQCLTVYEVTLVAVQKKHYIESPLLPDGFDVQTNFKDASTEDEKVRCDNCGEIFDLSDLRILR